MTTAEIILSVLAAIQLAVIAWLAWQRPAPLGCQPANPLIYVGEMVGSVVESYNERADRDAGRIDTLITQCMAISEKNLEWQTTAKSIENQGRTAPYRPPQAVPSMFDDGAAGGLGETNTQA